MIDKAITALSMLRPPLIHENGEKSLAEKTQLYDYRVRRWRWTVFYALLIIISFQAVDMTLSWGLSPVYAGFQPKDQALAAETRTARIELRLLEQDLLTTRIGQCEAANKKYFTERLSELRKQYSTMTGQAWEIPLCKEVGAKEAESE